MNRIAGPVFVPGVLLCFFWGLLGCEPKQEREIVAQFQGQQLSQAELALHMPDSLSPKDSARLSKDYIKQWKQEVALAETAKDSLRNYQGIVEPRLQAYKRQILIHQLQQHVVAQRLDTAISRTVLEEYYNKHVQEFQAKRPYFNYYYVGTANFDTPQLRKRLPSDKAKDHLRVEEWCQQHADQYKVNDRYEGIEKVKALQEHFPARRLLNLPAGHPVIVNKAVRNGTPVLHFFYMKDRIPKGKPKPLAMVAGQIKTLILNQRKQQLLAKFRKQVVDNAYVEQQ
jgi:hypothetical protein